MFNLIIKMEEGKIYEIVWDNGCFDCSNSCEKGIKSVSVLNSNITTSYENCYEGSCNSGNSKVCDPIFYVTWFGTDKNKRQMKTAGLAMTKFKNYSVQSLYSSIKNIFK